VGELGLAGSSAFLGVLRLKDLHGYPLRDDAPQGRFRPDRWNLRENRLIRIVTLMSDRRVTICSVPKKQAVSVAWNNAASTKSITADPFSETPLLGFRKC
jgi:hypothetical protein